MNKNTIKLKPILVVSATQKSTRQETRLHSCVQSLNAQCKFEFITDNTSGLPKVYNKFLTKKNESKHDIALFCHDDLYIDDVKLRGKLYKSIFADGYDIVGLAGASTCTVDVNKPALWHLMSERTSWSGTVFHPHGSSETTKIMSTTYGPTPNRCLLLDGLFLAVNIKSARQAKWKFNENFDFHHYDISSCIDANEKKLKLGTCMVHAVHDSPGLKSIEDPEFQKSNKKFLELYG